MFKNFQKYSYWLTTGIYALLALLFFGVLLKSFGYDAIKMWVYSPEDGNLKGLICGFAAYAIFLLFLISPKICHNLTRFMQFTHELTHTLIALLFFRRIEEFVVSRRDCHVHYQRTRFGYVPITLSPYCIPIYTFMLFPFRCLAQLIDKENYQSKNQTKPQENHNPPGAFHRLSPPFMLCLNHISKTVQ